jgi:hypothetical protein
MHTDLSEVLTCDVVTQRLIPSSDRSLDRRTAGGLWYDSFGFGLVPTFATAYLWS